MLLVEGAARCSFLVQLRATAGRLVADAGTRAAEEGLTSLEVAALLGHAQASTSGRYVHLARGVDHERAESIAKRMLGR
jgi:predicted transcriptional regulator